MRWFIMKLIRLKNKYTNERVFCRDINDVMEDTLYTFIKVFSPDNPNREYLVNRDAYIVELPIRDGNIVASSDVKGGES